MTAPDANGWRPIDGAREAMRDSRSRLVWCPENQCIYCANWQEVDDPHEYPPSGWRVFGGGYRTHLEGVTHWRPLPDPPA